MKPTQEQFNNSKNAFSKSTLTSEQKGKILGEIYNLHELQNSPKKHFLNRLTQADGPSMSEKSADFYTTVQKVVSSGSFVFRHRFIVGFAVILFLISGLSFASAQSLPGSALFNIKTKVLEPVELALKVNAKAKQEYKVMLLEKRVNELKKLKEIGKVTELANEQSFSALEKNIDLLKLKKEKKDINKQREKEIKKQNKEKSTEDANPGEVKNGVNAISEVNTTEMSIDEDIKKNEYNDEEEDDEDETEVDISQYIDSYNAQTLPKFRIKKRGDKDRSKSEDFVNQIKTERQDNTEIESDIMKDNEDN